MTSSKWCPVSAAYIQYHPAVCTYKKYRTIPYGKVGKVLYVPGTLLLCTVSYLTDSTSYDTPGVESRTNISKHNKRQDRRYLPKMKGILFRGLTKAQDLATKIVFGEDAVTSKMNFYDLVDRDMDGVPVKMSDFKGQTLLLVNVASKCKHFLLGAVDYSAVLVAWPIEFLTVIL